MGWQEELHERLTFMRFDGAASTRLRAVGPILMAQLPAALDAFYDQVRATPQTRAFFGDEAKIARAKDRQLAHWEAISSARFDDHYIQAVTTVGETHARIGLEPRWYIGGYAMLIEALIGAVVKSRWPKARLGGSRSAADDVTAEAGALVKAALLDMDYSISVYLAAAEAARRQAEAEVLAGERSTVVRSVGEAATALADGDLSYRMSAEMPVEYRKLREDFNTALGQLEAAMRAVMGTSGSLSANCDELASASDNLSQRTEQQAAALEQAAAALDDIYGRVKKTAHSAGQATQTVGDAKAEVERSGQVVASALQSVAHIEESSREIGQIIGVIDEIAFQTNLL
ncbi:protoglobin domain-containing protein, partial [Phenylobacterium sp. CCH9-H3]